MKTRTRKATATTLEEATQQRLTQIQRDLDRVAAAVLDLRQQLTDGLPVSVSLKSTPVLRSTKSNGLIGDRC